MHFSVNYSQYIIPKANNKSRTDIFSQHFASIFGPRFWYLVSTSSLRLTFLQAGFTLVSPSHLFSFCGFSRNTSCYINFSGVRGELCLIPLLSVPALLIELNLSWGHKVTLTHNCQTNAPICQNSVSGKIIHNSSIPLSVCMCCWNVLWFLAWLGLLQKYTVLPLSGFY